MFIQSAYLALNCLYMLLGISSGGFPPPLSADEEAKCFEKHEKGDPEARKKLIEHNLRLVSHIVRKYNAASPYQEDLVSIGTIGLIKAIDSFRRDCGTKFATYAARCIQNEILMYFRRENKLSCEVSINETIDMDKEGNPLTLMDIIATEDTIAEDIDRKIHIIKAIEATKKCLPDRERKIIELRYGLCGRDPLTQKEVADLMGISRSYVSRIEKSALEKIRKIITR